MTTTSPDAAIDPKADGNRSRRNLWFLRLAALVIISGVSWLAYWLFYSSQFVVTDNAYTAVELSQVTTAVEGTVKEVRVHDTQRVKAGDILALIDDADTLLTVKQAQSDLDLALRRVEGYFVRDELLAAKVLAREAEARGARAQVESAMAVERRMSVDFARRKALEKTGSVSGEELTRAESSAVTAQAELALAQANLTLSEANLASAKAERNMNVTLITGTTVSSHPEVMLARAKLEQAQINHRRTEIRASVPGVVSKLQIQGGQRVHIGQSVLVIVPVDEMHVNANFKEVQLSKIKVGQAVKVTSDLYGSQVVFKGRVEGFAAGTGAAFAIIPAQNATGNWIKVVQRVPVRIKLDSTELKAHPLTVGLSMTVRINVDASDK
jgi:membrane fusion protein (multidrug efflux system)